MNKQIIGIMLAAFFCAAGMVLGQAPSVPPHGLSGSSHRLPPELIARFTKQARLDQAARAALDAHDYAAEEEYARQSLDLGEPSLLGRPLLAQALKDQGKNQEALQIYKVLIVDQKDGDEDNLVPYALLLLKAGQSAQAFAIYKAVTLHPDDGEQILVASPFAANITQPKELAVALHIIQGVIYQGSQGWGYHLRREEGMREFAQALQLAPNSPLTNYYYGFGWQHLDPRSRTKIADAPRAKAALQKAAASEDNDIKKAAGETLYGLQ